MGDLRDQLKKAKLLSKKDAKRLAHEQRVERKEKGRDGLEQEQKQRQQELQQARDAERKADREREAKRAEQREHRAERAAVDDLLAHKAWVPGPGTVRWFFEADGGAVPFLECSAQELRRLQAGELAVVRIGRPGTHVYRLLTVDDARRVRTARPDAMAWAPRSL